mmetsp:Transcript_18470/g.21211  ORF Transcript_18470/g.21211 Transcript_18470/m.21211 type:complete len:315 (-) Transcript_18470:9-953(-)
MQVLHAMDNGGDENSITYVILKRDSTKQLFIGYSGTRDTQQLITEILEAFPVFYDIHPEATDALVFDYFYKHYLNGFRDDILKFLPGILDAYPKYNVIFTGHSLGGAMAVHAAGDFVLSGYDQNRIVSIYTFGQPRVGNPAFSDSFNFKVNGWFRVVHNRDVVAHLPSCLIGDIQPDTQEVDDLYDELMNLSNVPQDKMSLISVQAKLEETMKIFDSSEAAVLIDNVLPLDRSTQKDMLSKLSEGMLKACKHDGLLPFYPYHSPQEIFYDGPFSNYKECNATDGEDQTCSNSQINNSISDHLEYFGFQIGALSE